MKLTDRVRGPQLIGTIVSQTHKWKHFASTTNSLTCTT